MVWNRNRNLPKVETGTVVNSYGTVPRGNTAKNPYLLIWKKQEQIWEPGMQGEVNVAQEELNSFLVVAEDLRVKERLALVKLLKSTTF